MAQETLTQYLGSKLRNSRQLRLEVARVCGGEHWQVKMSGQAVETRVIFIQPAATQLTLFGVSVPREVVLAYMQQRCHAEIYHMSGGHKHLYFNRETRPLHREPKKRRERKLSR